jgi:hypothetical protein
MKCLLSSVGCRKGEYPHVEGRVSNCSSSVNMLYEGAPKKGKADPPAKKKFALRRMRRRVCI